MLTSRKGGDVEQTVKAHEVAEADDTESSSCTELLPTAGEPHASAVTSAPEDAEEGAEKGSDADSQCVVCLDAPKQYAFVPCGHVCVCVACSEDIMTRGRGCCPCCRADAMMVMRVYF